MASPPVIISLTAIPPRFRFLGPVLHDLQAQKAGIAEIRLNLPRHYRRFGPLPAILPSVPDGVRICLIDEDFGPATKVLPTVRDLRGQNAEILFCDDDQHYDPLWAQRFLDARRKKPDACIVESGYDIAERSRHGAGPHARLPRVVRKRRDLAYRLIRLGSLNLLKPNRIIGSGHVDILEGYRGALIRPDMLPEAAFHIPEILWTVDDPWLSGHLEANGVPIWLEAGYKWKPRDARAAKIERLYTFVHLGHGRKQADAACIAYFRKTYGIWMPPGPS